MNNAEKRSKDFSKKVKSACNAFQRRNIGPKQVIEDIINYCCILLADKDFITKAFPRTLYQFSSSFGAISFSHYKDEPRAHEIVQELVQDFITLIKESEPFTDTLGMLYDEYLGQTLGQFLTPPDVAYVLAAINLQGEDFSQERGISDCCGCGAGSLLLGSLRYIHETHGKEAIAKVHVSAVDLDINMVRMTAVQIVLHSILHQAPLASFRVSYGNAITDYTAINNHEKIGYWWIPKAPLDMYADIVGNRELDEVITLLKEFSEVTEKIKNKSNEMETV
ncbi:N-6 DNA methylase [Aquitalea pelogenes]|uniref:N-6 DNA methylase n=1 Tax=Aquitalea pelogenes TaxID=1293573 RepID=UPI0035B355D8